MYRNTGSTLFLLAALLPGCRAAHDAGRKGLVTGSFLGETEIGRVTDLMARDMVREPMFYGEGDAPALAVVKIENNTNQYLFTPARNAYMERIRTQLKQALGDRVVLIDEQAEGRLREQLRDWYLDEAYRDEDSVEMVRQIGPDYLLTATFDSLEKVVPVADARGKVVDQKIVELQMTFSLVSAENGELAWQNSVASSAAFTTRDFQN